MHKTLLKVLAIRLGVVLTFLTVVILILLWSSPANAESYMSFGVGAFKSADAHIFNLGYREPLIFDLTHQMEVGFWMDPAGNGRTGSAYAAYQVGMEVTPGAFVARFMVGPAVITSPDAYLGGVFPQFTEDLYIGIRDSKERSMGVKYKHMSSAGFFDRNVGRDFVTVEASIRW